jgi:hypothetical protein
MMVRITATFLLLAAIACGGREQQQTTATASQQEPGDVAAAKLTPEQLGELGAKMRKDPARAQELLTQHGLTEETFEKAIRDVTEDPAASKRYAEAYRRGTV